ncbi:MAG: hypothetical protein ISR58_11560 [Anaerolineales bacterium]|nr:hypothetical protein [Chloroflexota bacterium]MBL6981812.1 hypothetical protein [Anaerolineales bacterium]
MKRTPLIITLLLTLTLACGLGGCAGGSDDDAAPIQPPIQGDKRCGDGVCDGPEDAGICPEDCSAGVDVDEGQTDSADAEKTNPASVDAQAQPTVGIVYAEVELDRTAGNGDCGIDPWYSADCTSMKTWWGLDIKAVAETAVLIIPDGDGRWVVTNHPNVISKYNIDLNNFLTSIGEIQSASIDFSPVPECSGEIEVADFNFQVMGTHEAGLLELILSANPEEFVEGACAGTGFSYTTTHLLYGWAAALSGDPLDLSFQMNDTFKDQHEKYTFEVEIDTNPSPEDRDHVSTILEFICLPSQATSIMEPVACPWNQ